MALICGNREDDACCATHRRFRSNTAAILLYVVIFLLASHAAHAGRLDQVVAFDIEAQTLDQALLQFGTQAHVQIMFASDFQARQQRTLKLKGHYTGRAALASLLRGSRMRFLERGDTIEIITDSLRPMQAQGSAAQDPHLPVASKTPLSQDPPQEQRSEGEHTTQKRNDALETIVVTGTHIHGADPVSPMIVLTRRDIDASGYSTTGDLIRALPISFSGGQNPGVVGAPGASNTNNYAEASSADLRGLGPESTLTLLDGHRLAFTGVNNAVDLSIIPLAAISQVQIVTDSSSAIYGSDAVGGVVNFILRRNYNGAQTSVQVGGASDGGATEQTVGQLLGKEWTSGNLLIAYEYARSEALFANQRSFSMLASEPTTLLPDQRHNSILLSANQDISSSVSVYADLLYSDRDALALSNAYSVLSNIPSKDQQYALAAGVEFSLGSRWHGSIDGDFARDDNDVMAFEKVLSFPIITTPIEFSNKLESLSVSVDGGVLNTAAGEVSLALGAGRKSEKLAGYYTYQIYGSRATNDGFAELRVPLMGEAFSSRVVRSLVLSLAVRHEDYSDFAGVTNPSIGVAYRPIRTLTVRGTYGRSFIAPPLYDEYDPITGLAYRASALGVPAAAQATVLAIDGGNPSLRPETAKSWTAGLSYRSARVDPIGLDLTAFKISYSGRIVVPLNSLLGIYNNPLDQPFIVKDPTVSEVDSALANLAQLNNFTGSASLDPASVAALYERTYQNVVDQDVRGVDLVFDWPTQFGIGRVQWVSQASFLDIRQKNTTLSPELTITGTIYNPPRWKLRGGVIWGKAGWRGSLFVNGISSEVDDSAGLVQGSTATDATVGSFITVDGMLSYEYRGLFSIVSGTRVAVAVQNLLNRYPPRVSPFSTSYPNLGYDSTNASPLGRFVSVTLTKEW